ncbi:hypothetical protein TrST_g1809 [Triparma strigata]|uniref:Glutamate/phenylalanine/leucine/valine/L-tryptophan dehydrogenase C-terminal domain-containing protein n=1 Tax=Triparma strigata TaxID=1606541 RepID=A0A9W7F0C0_9STRA|nr:hypothetical protein TrST_g1809 [Triparma strigata]
MLSSTIYHARRALTRRVIVGANGRYLSDKSWQASGPEIQEATKKALIHDLLTSSTASIHDTVPWFLENMPASYFRQTNLAVRTEHLKAIASLRSTGGALSLDIRSDIDEDRKVVTFIRPNNEVGMLLKQIKSLPKYNMPLSRVGVYTTDDNMMCLNMFTFGEHSDTSARTIDDSHPILELASKVAAGEVEFEGVDKDAVSSEMMKEYMAKCGSGYLNNSVGRRFLNQMGLYNAVTGSEGVEVSVEKFNPTEYSTDGLDPNQTSNMYWIDSAIANSLPQYALEYFARVAKVNNLDIIRTHLDNVNDGDNGTVTQLRMLVRVEVGEEIDWGRLKRNLKRQKWIDPLTADLIEKNPSLGIRRAEIITGLASLMHPIMGKVNPVAYSKANIFAAVTSNAYIHLGSEIADYFLQKFNPKSGKMSEADQQAATTRLREKIDSEVVDRSANTLLHKMVEAVNHTYRTNVYMENRYALSLRLDPAIMQSDNHEASPYGVVFAHGRRFNGYHVRFRDISRGGMRIVTPASPEQLALESGRHYDECYGLSFAQQMKNKDIPEGGSKCVALVDTVGMSQQNKNFVMRKSVKAFSDSMLDLIVDTPETQSDVLDYYGKPEVLYLGPDEQVIPEDIDWIVQRAAKRGYRNPSAFMSSKPKAGINHKEFGVTSEGVNVFLDVALREVLKIDPTKESFSVKLTGGTDGDVAGNEINILYREYGDNVKIVGLGDHTAALEDPNGLDREELLRLFHGSLPLDEYDPSKLSPTGALHTVDTDEGVRMRNTMHNRVKADAFIPAGGRPNTVDINNWEQFLDEEGKPTSGLIVEGANLFVTAEARQKLFEEAGVIVVKDSSANKAGVICSSYEICAAMLLSESEFLDNKDEIVADVLKKLRYFARVEAELLFREFNNYPGALPHFSALISDTINVATDAIREELVKLPPGDLDQLLGLVKTHLPKKMATMAFDRLKTNVPEQYLIAAIASSLASKIVYAEGVNFVKSQPPENLSALALKYLEAEKEVALLENALSGASGLDEGVKEEVLDLLKRGGVRSKLNVF